MKLRRFFTNGNSKYLSLVTTLVIRKLLLPSLFVVLVSPASASLMFDWDGIRNIEWLDPATTTGYSRIELKQQFSDASSAFYGYRYASRDEYTSLMDYYWQTMPAYQWSATRTHYQNTYNLVSLYDFYDFESQQGYDLTLKDDFYLQQRFIADFGYNSFNVNYSLNQISRYAQYFFGSESDLKYAMLYGSLQTYVPRTDVRISTRGGQPYSWADVIDYDSFNDEWILLGNLYGYDDSSWGPTTITNDTSYYEGSGSRHLLVKEMNMIPEPTTLFLLGIGLLSLTGFGRRKT